MLFESSIIMALKIKNDKHPLALNIMKFQRYNFNHFNCEEVILFEYLVVKGNAFKQNPFYHSSETIFKETGIKKHSLNSIIKRFTALKYISIEVKGMPKVKHFTIHYPNIYADRELIYLLTENGRPLYDFRQLLAEFFLPLIETYQQKNTIKNTIKNTKKENEKEKENELSDTESLSLKKFNAIVLGSKIKHSLNPTQFEFNDAFVLKALKTYSMEDLEKYMEQFLKEGRQKKIKDFLKFDTITNEKILYIEEKKNEEEQFVESFLKNLQDSYTHRIEMFNKDKKNKRNKSETTLVLNANIKTKIKEAVTEKGEIAFNHAFMAYTDAVLERVISPDKFLPYFLAKQFGEYGVIETYLDKFNLNYSYPK